MSDEQRAEAEAKVKNKKKPRKHEANAMLIASEGGFEIDGEDDEGQHQTEKQRILSKLNSDMNELNDDEEEENR